MHNDSELAKLAAEAAEEINVKLIKMENDYKHNSELDANRETNNELAYTFPSSPLRLPR